MDDYIYVLSLEMTILYHDIFDSKVMTRMIKSNDMYRSLNIFDDELKR